MSFDIKFIYIYEARPGERILNRSASLAMLTSTSVLKALPGKLDIKIHSPSIIGIGSFSIFRGGRGSPPRLTSILGGGGVLHHIHTRMHACLHRHV